MAKKRRRYAGKGQAFERKTCKQLSLWITNGEREDCFWRTAMSGGRATVHHKRGVEIRQGGDICAVVPEGHEFCDYWFVELKHYRDLDIASFLLKDKGTLARFWKKTIQQAERHNRSPMLIAKQNNFPTLVIGPATRNPERLKIPAEGHRELTPAHIYFLDDILKLPPD